MTALIDPARSFQRARITLHLEALSPLHLGDGEIRRFDERKQQRARTQVLSAEVRAATPDDSDYATVCRDSEGRPYLPGSSLRGWLRQLIGDLEPDLGRRLFGPEPGAATLHMGALRIRDAVRCSLPRGPHLPDALDGTGIVHSVSIEPITGAADEHYLFAEEFVAAGTRFGLQLELGPCDHDELETLLSVLHAVDADSGNHLGAGRSHGFGAVRVRADTLEVRALDSDALKTWLVSEGPTSLPWRKLSNLSAAAHADAAASRHASLTFDLCMDAPFAVHDPGHVGLHALPKNAPAEERSKVDAEDRYPDIEFSRDPDGKPILPGRTLRGLLRHRAQRILTTLLHVDFGVEPGTARAHAQAILVDIFGDTRRRSAVQLSQASLVPDGGDGVSEHTFNAVDRFTGGVADSKLYSARLSDARRLRFTLRIDPRIPAIPDWWLGLGLLVLRDAVEGDLAVGWGKAKGLGALHLQWQGQPDWAATLALLRARHGDTAPQTWVNALRARLEAQQRRSETVQETTA